MSNPYSAAELRNMVHYAFDEMQRSTCHDHNSFKVGFLTGFIISKMETKQYTVEQLTQIHSSISKIISEFVFKFMDSEDLSESDIDCLLAELEREIAESNEIESVYKNEVEATKEDERLIAEQSAFFERTYQSVCDWITQHFDSELLRIDQLEDQHWIPAKEREIETSKLRRQISIGSDEKLKSLLNNDPRQLYLFHRWLRSKDGPDDDDGPCGNGSEFWKNA